ncbi:hypothetical protein [Stappia sp. WLB 29]|nr:hypothetical protein [Stappia sp. WLB 29]
MNRLFARLACALLALGDGTDSSSGAYQLSLSLDIGGEDKS